MMQNRHFPKDPEPDASRKDNETWFDNAGENDSGAMNYGAGMNNMGNDMGLDMNALNASYVEEDYEVRNIPFNSRNARK